MVNDYDEISKAVDRELEPENVIDKLDELKGHEVVIFTDRNGSFNGLLRVLAIDHVEVNDCLIKRQDIMCVWDYGRISVPYLVVPEDINTAARIIEVGLGESISDYFVGYDDEGTRVFRIDNGKITELGENDGTETQVETINDRRRNKTDLRYHGGRTE